MTLTSKPGSSEFYENESSHIRCELYGISKNKVVDMIWFKDNQEIDKKNVLNMTMDVKEMRLNFFNLSHLTNNGKVNMKHFNSLFSRLA